MKCANACYFPEEIFVWGVWRDGNELNGLLRIRKCHSFYCRHAEFFSAKEDYKQGYFLVDDRKHSEGEG